MRKLIMIIDDNKLVHVAGRESLQDTYDIISAENGYSALQILRTDPPDLILLDINMPDMDGFEVIKRIKENERTAQIPVIFLTALDSVKNEYEGLSLGAADYITKPFKPQILRKRIETHLSLAEQTFALEKLVEKKTYKILQLQDAILSTMAELVESRDSTTGGHVDRTQSYIKLLVDRMTELGLYTEAVAAWDLGLMVQAAQLHDLGKIGVPDSILNKPGKLTEEEFEIIKHHAQEGKDAIEKIEKKVDDSEFLHQAELMAYTHHERWDGSGYPQGLKGEEIPIHGRLMAIVDVYDALISERPYKKAYSHEEAVKIIAEGKGTQFDPVLTDVFIEIENKFHEIAKGKEE